MIMPPPTFLAGFCLPSAWGSDLPNSLSRLKDYGFDGIELWPDAFAVAPAKQWADALAGAGLACLQLCPYFDFVHGETAIAESERQLHLFLDYADTLSCRRIRTFTGPVWGEGLVGSMDATPAQWDATVTQLQRFCDLADAHSEVELCLECHAGNLTDSAESTRQLCECVERHNLTVNLQLPFAGENVSGSVALLKERTTHLHVHNWNVAVGDECELTFLDSGVFDWEPVVRELLVGRHSVVPLCLSSEHVTHNDRHDPWETAERDGRYFTSLRNRLSADAPLFGAGD